MTCYFSIDFHGSFQWVFVQLPSFARFIYTYHVLRIWVCSLLSLSLLLCQDKGIGFRLWLGEGRFAGWAWQVRPKTIWQTSFYANNGPRCDCGRSIISNRNVTSWIINQANVSRRAACSSEQYWFISNHAYLFITDAPLVFHPFFPIGRARWLIIYRSVWWTAIARLLWQSAPNANVLRALPR